MPAKYPKLKRALTNSGTNAQSTIVRATACQKLECPGVLLRSTTVIDKQVMTTRTISSGICHASPPDMSDWLGAFMAVSFSIERDIGRQRGHDQDQRQHKLGADVLCRMRLLVVDHPAGTHETICRHRDQRDADQDQDGTVIFPEHAGQPAEQPVLARRDLVCLLHGDDEQI